ncbi:hypothetical protein BDF21DRAFT_245687 [Thamnidium elegans]|nr:hypothetical protein BDF21DRAFT_245687 [Thamnidium elegans]
MSDQPVRENVEQIFTREQVDAIVEAVTKRLRESQSVEVEQRYKGVELPEEVYTELESYNQHELQKALQKFKRTIPNITEEWNTPETTNPDFISPKSKTHLLKQTQINTHPKVLTSNRLLLVLLAVKLWLHS